MSRGSQVLLRALVMSLCLVTLIVLVRGFFHSWGELAQLDFWIEKAVIFVIFAAVMSVFYWRTTRPKS